MELNNFEEPSSFVVECVPRSRGPWLEPHWNHCVRFLNKRHFIIVQSRKLVLGLLSSSFTSPYAP